MVRHALERGRGLQAPAARTPIPGPWPGGSQTIYLRALLDLYGEELGPPEPDRGTSSLQLAPFQRDGYERARRILAEHQGVLYADGVGTGKTEVGLAFIEEYALRRGQHALVVAPAQLRDIWEQRTSQARLPAQVVTFQQLAADEQLAADTPNARRHLHNDRAATASSWSTRPMRYGTPTPPGIAR